MGIETQMASDAIAEASIQTVLGDFVAAWNKHDAVAFSMVFADDADFTNVRGVGAHGRTEIAKFHGPVFATVFKESHQRIVESKIRFISADVAMVDAWWEMTGARTREGQEIAVRKGLLILLMTKKEDSHWRITIMHNMDLPITP